MKNNPNESGVAFCPKCGCSITAVNLALQFTANGLASAGTPKPEPAVKPDPAPEEIRIGHVRKRRRRMFYPVLLTTPLRLKVRKMHDQGIRPAIIREKTGLAKGQISTALYAPLPKSNL